MSCNTSTDNCGCLNPTNTDCVFIKSLDSNCLNINNGDTLTSALTEVLTYVCNITPSGSLITVVEEGTGVTVTSSTNNNTTTYVVNISQEVLDQINTTEANVIEALDCNTQQVYDIVSIDNSVTVTVESSDSCGRILNLSVPSPSGSFYKGGIIYNNASKVGTSGASTQQTLKSFKISDNYDTSTLTDGDEIRFRATGQIKGDDALSDTLIIELHDNSGLLISKTFSGFSASNSYNSFIADCSLTITDYSSGEGVLNIIVNRNSVINGNVYSVGKNLLMVNADVTSIDFSTLEIHIDFNHLSSSSGSDNYARQLLVEIAKTI